MRRGFQFIIVLMASILCFGVGCGDEPASQQPSAENAAKPEKPVDLTPAFGDMLVIGSIGDAENLLPVISSDSVSTDVNDLVYNALVKVGRNMDIVPDLAERWEFSDEGRTITFFLHKGVKWHDGRPFTANDCLFTYQVMVDPKTPTAYAEQFKQIEKAEVIDDYTFRVTYKKVFARALITWGMNIVPKHLLEGKDVSTSDLIKNPVGTGPYVFQSWETGQKIELRANPDYFKGRPHIERIVTRVIPDLSTMDLELRNGTLDWMNQTPDQFVRSSKNPEFTKNFNQYTYLDNGYTYLGFNLLDERFRDKRVRQALSYAVNKEELIQGVLLGLGKPANGPYKPGHWAHNPNVTPYTYDPEKAKILLDEAGWKDTDGDGIRDKNGRPFAFTIMTNQGNKKREQTAVIIQRRLKDVGIDTKVRTMEWAAFLKEYLDKKKFDAVVMGWTIPIDPDLYNVWHSSKTKEGELNFISFKNDEMDRLIDEGRFTVVQEERQKAYHSIQEILKEEAPCVFLFVPDALEAVSSRFHGIDPGPAGIDYNIPEWFVPESLHKYQPTQ